MNFFVENWLLIAVAFVSGGMLVWPLVRGGGGAGAVGASEAVRMMNREKALLIDVSEPREFDAGHAAQARNVPVGQLETSKELPSNKALPLVVLCPTGARAGRAAATLRKLGYANVRALAGGMAAWREAGLPTEKSGTAAGRQASKGGSASPPEAARPRPGGHRRVRPESSPCRDSTVPLP